MISSANCSYESTFNSRGESYDCAMRTFPEARKHEFETLLKLADLKDGDLVCDLPSGGGYIENYINQKAHLTLLETSELFYERCLERRTGTAVLTTENVIPFCNNHFDKVLSLAGIHHNSRQDGFFEECARCLKPGGILCIADVHEKSSVARFLNVFVDQHNPDGHNGSFLGDHSLKSIQNAGLHLDYSEVISYPWVFNSLDDMTAFCTMLFGITPASPSEVMDGIESYVGFKQENGLVLMNWQLYFLRARKPH